MKKILKTIRALGILVQNPWKLNHILNQNEEWEKYVHKNYKIDSLPVIPINHFIQEPITIEPYAFLEGGSSPTDLALLKQIASGIGNCKYFEIGTWRGESVANVASSADTCFTLNLPEEMLIKILNDKDFIDSQHFFSKDIRNVIHLRGNANTFDYSSLETRFDLIFIDGDHHYESIVNDTRKVLEYLSHDQTIVVWHDYGYNPESIRYETMAAILDSFPVAMHHHLFHVSNTNCAILYKKSVASYKFKKYALPEYQFSVSLKIHPI